MDHYIKNDDVKSLSLLIAKLCDFFDKGTTKPLKKNTNYDTDYAQWLRRSFPIGVGCKENAKWSVHKSWGLVIIQSNHESSSLLKLLFSDYFMDNIFEGQSFV